MSFQKPSKKHLKYQMLNRGSSILNRTDIITPSDQLSVQIELSSGESTIKSSNSNLRRKRMKVYNLKGNSITVTHTSDTNYYIGRNTLVKIRRNSEILRSEKIRVIKRNVSEVLQLRDTVITDNCVN